MPFNIVDADHELTDEEISATFREIFAEANTAFRTDPGYICEIAEAIAGVDKRRMKARKGADGKRLTKEALCLRNERIMGLRAANWTMRAIAEHVDVSVNTVSIVVHRDAKADTQV